MTSEHVRTPRTTTQALEQSFVGLAELAKTRVAGNDNPVAERAGLAGVASEHATNGVREIGGSPTLILAWPEVGMVMKLTRRPSQDKATVGIRWYRNPTGKAGLASARINVIRPQELVGESESVASEFESPPHQRLSRRVRADRL